MSISSETRNSELQAPSRAYTSAIVKQSSRINVADSDSLFAQHLEATSPSGQIPNGDEYFSRDQGQEAIMEPLVEEYVDDDDESPTTVKFDTFKIKWRVVSMFLWFFAVGWNDATAGTILSYIEDYYNISYALVALVWLGNALGFVTIAALSHKLNNTLGFYKMVVLSPAFYVVAGSLITPGTKFGAIVVGYYFAGLGGAIGLSQFNVYLSRFEIAPTLLGAAHGSYGFGATMAPIIATLMTDHSISWHYFYAFILAFMAFSTVNIFFAFKGIDQELNELNHEETHQPLHISESLKDLNTWLVCFFILFYQGAEVGLAGYIVSYLLDYRNGDLGSVGYVASGFWGGLTLGRFGLTTIMLKKLGARRSILLFTSCSIAFILLSWFIPNLIAESVCISIAGFFIGPMYPMVISYASRVLPRKIAVVSLSLSSAFGSAGGSLFPFLVGLISQFKGSFVVLPFSIGLFVAMVLCWIGLPNLDRPNVKTWWERLV